MYKDASTEEYITTLVLPVVTDKVLIIQAYYFIVCLTILNKRPVSAT